MIYFRECFGFFAIYRGIVLIVYCFRIYYGYFVGVVGRGIDRAIIAIRGYIGFVKYNI